MKKGKGMECPHCGMNCHCGFKWIAALVIFAVGVLFILQDLGMGFLPAGLSIWHVLVALLGLKMLIHSTM